MAVTALGTSWIGYEAFNVYNYNHKLQTERPDCYLQIHNDKLYFLIYLSIFAITMGKIKTMLIEFFGKHLPTDVFPVGSVSRDKKIDLMAEKLPRTILHIFFTIAGWLIVYNSPWLHTSLGGTTENV